MRQFTLVLMPALLVHCADPAGDCKKNGNCDEFYDGSLDTGGTSGNGGTPNGGSPSTGGEGGHAGTTESGGSAAGGGGGGGNPCTATTPDEDACVITNDHGVFVSPDGSDDDGDGTQSAPFATLGKAIETAAADDKQVYACATSGDYTEALRLDSEAAEVALFGGFDCDTWAYDTATKARIAPSDPHAVVAASADGLALYDLEIVAPDATESGQSSIALTLLDTDATLTRVTLTAGQGAAGTDGALTTFEYTDIDDLAGCDALDGDGNCFPANGGACTQTCEGGGTTTGGARGGPGGSGGTGLPLGTSNGGTLGADCSTGAGKKGDDGTDGTDGTGAQTHGTLTATGWTPVSGADGTPGAVGQGGGGGSGGPSSGTGGGGGCGGCGGNGATAGQGGGSSIALLSFSSAVTLAECTLTAADGGNGGYAEEGQRGQYNPDEATYAGLGGNPVNPGCPGGPGGLGGNGGASGGGAGGLSVGILHNGTAPTLDDATSGAITTGTAGDGGTAVSGKADTAGLDGVAEATHETS